MDIGGGAAISARAFPPLPPRRFTLPFRPKYISFDCYGTLTYFPMHQMAYDLYEGQLPPEQMRLNRGHEPRPNEAYNFAEIRDINGLPALVGL
jgi:hypothetical protein